MVKTEKEGASSDLHVTKDIIKASRHIARIGTIPWNTPRVKYILDIMGVTIPDFTREVVQSVKGTSELQVRRIAEGNLYIFSVAKDMLNTLNTLIQNLYGSAYMITLADLFPQTALAVHKKKLGVFKLGISEEGIVPKDVAREVTGLTQDDLDKLEKSGLLAKNGEGYTAESVIDAISVIEVATPEALPVEPPAEEEPDVVEGNPGP